MQPRWPALTGSVYIADVMRRGRGRLGWLVSGWRMGLAVVSLLGCKSAPPTPYPPDIVEAFVKACTANASESNCRCAIDRIQRKFTLDEYLAFENRITHRDIPKELVDATADCRER